MPYEPNPIEGFMEYRERKIKELSSIRCDDLFCTERTFCSALDKMYCKRYG